MGRTARSDLVALWERDIDERKDLPAQRPLQASFTASHADGNDSRDGNCGLQSWRNQSFSVASLEVDEAAFMRLCCSSKGSVERG